MPVVASPPAGRLRVNPIRCTAFGFCAEYAPELFALDEWGYAWPHGREISADLEALAREAAALCPTRAILVESLRATASPPHTPTRRE